MMKLYKILFFNTMIIGSLISISSMSWFSMWMGLEINLLSVIPLFSTKDLLSSEASMKYFITQAMASMILLFSIIMMLLNNEFIPPVKNSTLMIIMQSALMLKLGAAPFHFWFPEVMEGLSWINCLILLTWQKIAPMILIMAAPANLGLIYLVILACLGVSTMMSLNQTSLRLILAFSSINHIAWMLSAMLISQTIWLFYMSIYALINSVLVMMFKTTNSLSISQINSAMNFNKSMKMSFMVNLLSLGGLPPMIGFLPKWLIINWAIHTNLEFLGLTLIVFTLITLFVYIRIMLTTLTLNSQELKTSQTTKISKTVTHLNLLSVSALILCTLMFNLE